MDWRWFLIGYLTISLILGEGLIFYNKKRGLQTEKHEYLILLFLGPLTLVAMLVANALRRRPK
jgi:hypothetical protein